MAMETNGGEATQKLPEPPKNKARLRHLGSRSVAILLCAGALSSIGYLGWRRIVEKPALGDTGPSPVRLDEKTVGLAHIESHAADAMKVGTVVAREPREGVTLRLRGQLVLDPSRLVHVHTRFAGEVISIADVAEGDQTRQIRVGDHVKKGELLAVLWSKEIGEKKSDLVDAWSQLFLHETLLRNLKKLEGGAVAQRTIEEMQRNYEADLIEVTRLRRTLRSWRISGEEMDEIEAEARRLHKLAQAPQEKDSPPASGDLEAHWAEIEIRAPRDGLILEKNFNVGDIIDTNLDLFKIADLSRLGVMANAYEEDLPRLDSLQLDQRQWRIELHSLPDSPPLTGRFESIGHLIDPNQHTAIVTGWIDNPDGLLRVGQFVETIIDLPVDHSLVELPIDSILDAGQKAYVFVAHDDRGRDFEKREVKIVRRNSEFVWVAAKPEAALQAKPLEAGQKVVVGGVIEINSALGGLEPPPTAN